MNAEAEQIGEFFFASKDDIEIERETIALLIWAYANASPAAITELKLQDEFFSHLGFGAIYRAIQEVSDKGLPVQPSVIQGHFGDNPRQFEGWEQWTEILSTTPPVVPTSHLSQLLTWLSVKIRKSHFDRERVRASQEYTVAIVERDSTAESQARAKLEEIELATEVTEALEIDKAILRSIDLIEKTMTAKATLISTGIEKLDKFTTGFREGELWVIGARPSQGKTSLALNMFDAASDSARCHFISLEMTIEQLVIRWNVMHSGVPMNVITAGEGYKGQDVTRISNAFSRIRGHSAAINDNQELGELQSLRNEIVSAAKKGAKVIFIDYLQLIVSKHEKDRRLEIDAITRSMKRLAMQFKLSIVLLAQLNRGADGKTPTMGDLKESSGIEQNADKIILIDRPNKSNDAEAKAEEAYLVLEKQRNGVTGDIAVTFEPVRMKFVQSHHQRSYE